jgi:hypothetical protein
MERLKRKLVRENLGIGVRVVVMLNLTVIRLLYP